MRNALTLRMLATALACLPCAAHAIYKCAGPASTPVYQDAPCPAGKELRNFDTDPPTLSVVPGQPVVATPRETPPRPARSTKPPKPANGAKPRGDPAERKHVRVGMAEAEVLMRLGRPDITTGNRQKRNVRWTWLPVDGDKDTMTTVTIANGTVADVDRRVVRR